METKEPTGPDFQRQLRHLEEQVDQNRHDLDALMQRADDNHARADAADTRADEQRARTDRDRDRISALEARTAVDRQLIQALHEDGLMAQEHAANLEEALRTSRLIGAALGIIMAHRKVTEPEAFATLSKASQNTNTKLYRLATEIVDTGDVSDLPA